MNRRFLVLIAGLFTCSAVFSPTAYAEGISVSNSENGAGSENEVVIEISQETTIESSNEANIENDVDVEANTGENTVESNVGDVSLETGDIAVDVAISNDVNEASVEVDVCCCGGEYEVSNSKNGVDSQNSISVSVDQSVTVNDYKDADIQNSVGVDASTGGNNIGGNVGGASLKTGDIGVSVAIGNETNENEVDVGCPHCGGPEQPSEPDEPNGGPEEPESESDEPSSGDDGEESSENGEEAKPYEDPRPGPTFDSGEVLAAATELINGQALPITGPSEWMCALTLLLFLLAHSSRRLSYRYLYN